MLKNVTATNKKILELFNQMKNSSLILKPSFQRNLVWNDTHKKNFIQTILLGLPFPEIYLADDSIDLETQTNKTLVVDGQQRLSTIYQYVTSSPPFDETSFLPSFNNNTEKEIEIPKFADLPPERQTNFFDYNVVIRDLGRIEESQIRDIFKRINSVNYALNAVEINNALYEGEFIKAAKTILEANEIFKEANVFTSVFSGDEISRMKDLEYILLMMATIEEGGYFTGNKGVEEYIRNYDDEYPNKEIIIANFYEVLKLIVSCNLPADTIWNKRSSFFTLVVELVKLKKIYSDLPDIESLKSALVSLENELDNNKREDVNANKYAQYYYYTHQGTTSKKGRYIRGTLLQEYIEKTMNIST